MGILGKTPEQKKAEAEAKAEAKKAPKAIPLSQMKPNSDLLEAGINTSEEYKTKKEKEDEAKEKKEVKKTK